MQALEVPKKILILMELAAIFSWRFATYERLCLEAGTLEGGMRNGECKFLPG